MNALMNDIWPFLLTALLTALAGYVGYINSLKTRVSVLENTIKTLSQTIESMQKRMDSHSKKQDEIFNSINAMKIEVLKQMGAMGSDIGSLASDVKNLNNLLAITDVGIKIDKRKKK